MRVANATTACSACGRPFTNGQRSGTCPKCRKRASRQREKLAAREDPDQNVRAYLSDELGLSEADKAGVEHLPKTKIKDPETGEQIGVLGVASMEELLRCIERNGRADGIIESAWALPLWQFRQVEEAWLAAQPRDSSQAWRRSNP
jgi:uncharacterized Zn finger protein (UPF0148 family)